jgi:hypothetical protein
MKGEYINSRLSAAFGIALRWPPSFPSTSALSFGAFRKLVARSLAIFAEARFETGPLGE